MGLHGRRLAWWLRGSTSDIHGGPALLSGGLGSTWPLPVAAPCALEMEPPQSCQVPALPMAPDPELTLLWLLHGEVLRPDPAPSQFLMGGKARGAVPAPALRGAWRPTALITQDGALGHLLRESPPGPLPPPKSCLRGPHLQSCVLP